MEPISNIIVTGDRVSNICPFTWIPSLCCPGQHSVSISTRLHLSRGSVEARCRQSHSARASSRCGRLMIEILPGRLFWDCEHHEKRPWQLKKTTPPFHHINSLNDMVSSRWQKKCSLEEERSVPQKIVQPPREALYVAKNSMRDTTYAENVVLYYRCSQNYALFTVIRKTYAKESVLDRQGSKL